MTFLTDTMKKGYTKEEIIAVLFESEQDKKRRRMLAIVTEMVDAHRLQKMRELLAFEKLVTWRRMNGFDRVVDGEDNWFYGPRSLPLTPEEYVADLRCEVNALKNAISMPAETRPWQKTMDFVDGLNGKLPDEGLAVIKRYVERRSREAAQAQVTVTPIDTVQHCNPCPLNHDMPPDVCFKLESNKGQIDPELKELESPSAGPGLETPGQQCPPNEGTWETRRTTADGFLTAGVGANQGENISSPREHVGTRAGTAATPEKRRHKTSSEENTQLNPGGKGEKAPFWNAAVTLCFFWGKRWAMGGSLLVLRVFCLCFVCACLFCSLNCCSFQVITSQRAEKHEGRRGSSRSYTQPEGKHFLAYRPLEDGEDKHHPVRS